ncbi:hypothetical protein DY262_18265 [Hydrogenophaga borbori]|uniref:Uncharacterized protein n=1 Tax=Hydrogenophaga borbori TaxID=2294117 RepID=A0A372EEW5_9BURK|nr:hypothetical protein [Hydrogenophaga borbori]RFP76960.1 hypothetical protein DY262_18265 [Hydrogenophaga borbori]
MTKDFAACAFMHLQNSRRQVQRALDRMVDILNAHLRSHILHLQLDGNRRIAERTNHYYVLRDLRTAPNVFVTPVGRGVGANLSILDVELAVIRKYIEVERLSTHPIQATLSDSFWPMTDMLAETDPGPVRILLG